MKRRSSRYFLRVLLNTLVGYLLAAAIIFAVLIVLLLLNVGIESWEAILLIIGAVCCGIAVSAVMTYYAMKKQTQLIRDIDRVLDAISEGDLTARLPLTRYDVHLDKIITKFNAAIGELNSVAILKSDFIRNFSHEFKTPIASIKGFAELLYRDKALSQEEQERYCKIIAEESARLSRLAEMTLLFGKFDAQNIILDREPCYLDEEIGECILELYEAADKKGQTVEIEIGHIAVSASKALSRQLWINLFSNAAKYTGEHGHIALSARENAEEIVVSFRDDGIGMTEETMKHIFLAYYQADASRHGHGIGLGLAICKRIADLHGWKIEVSSEFGKGSTFSVHIPRTVPEAEGSASETEKVSHESVGLHTL